MVLLASLSATAINIQNFNPKDYGLFQANNGVERFEALMRCHMDAVNNNGRVSYEGVKTIEIEIPHNAQSIPLPEETDFANVKLYVTNKDRNYILFRLEKNIHEIDISGKSIDEGKFDDNPTLNTGLKLLVVEDQKLWVNERIGYKSNGYKRKDVLVLKNGKAQNQTIQPYNNEYSSAKGWYCNVSAKKKTVKNLNFYRTEVSTFKTYPVLINYQYNVELSSISMTTPQNTQLVDDNGIMVYDCAKVVLNDIRINGTYSKETDAGSGVRLINVYDVKINRMFARSEWGVFGNYHVNSVILKDCDINRFDIHCYGRDIKSIRCKYSKQYNQFSSVYGLVSFIQCEFDDFIPFLMESSYNAYTPFDLKWKNCSFKLTKNHNYFITLFRVPEPYNERAELRRKCLPNITIENCKVSLDENVDEWYLVQTHGIKYKDTFDYIREINIKGLKVDKETKQEFMLFSEDIKTSNQVRIKMKW